VISRVWSELESLSGTLTIATGSSVMGWTVDSLELDDIGLKALGRTYQALIVPDLPADVVKELEKDGLPCKKLFYGEAADNTTTRSDMTELAAAASLIAANGVSVKQLHLPNIPKGSRKQSAPGIDVIAALVDITSTGSTLGAGERLIICSVKHTIVDVSDLRYQLAMSVDEKDLSIPYLFSQLRVVLGRLEDRGIDASRLALALRNFPDAAFVSIIAVGAADSTQSLLLAQQLKNLPQKNVPTHHFRQMLVPNISALHELANQ
jgi:hypothetical protein